MESAKKFSPDHRSRLYFILLLIAIPIAIYFYFIKFRAITFYGDDLYVYREYVKLHGFYEKLNLPVNFGKYRPVHGLNVQLMINWFNKNTYGYYLYNVGLQTINTYIFALIINLFLRSALFSLFFSLIIGLSRFEIYNLNQLTYGAAMEGIAMTFFLASLFFVVKTLVTKKTNSSRLQKGILWGILFANLSMYAHERYVVIFPFLILVSIFFPTLKVLNIKQKVVLVSLSLASIALNVFLKKYIYSLPFFLGTANSGLKFSFSTSMSFLIDGILSIFQINSGDEYLIGVKFTSLAMPFKLLALVIFSSLVLIFGLYLFKVFKAYKEKSIDNKLNFPLFFFLSIIMGLLLVPAVSTIRLEPRWLQGSFSVFIIMTVIAMKNIQFKKIQIRNYVFSLFIILFIIVDFNYSQKGLPNYALIYSDRLATIVKQAIDNNIIHPAADTLYIWKKQIDENGDNGVRWALGDGYLFEFYQNKPKTIIFADSAHKPADFNKNIAQIVYIENKVIDITDEYLQDSLKKFTAQITNEGLVAPIYNDEKELVISNENWDKFAMSGFYENENGIRWTNGNAAIGFLNEYSVKDSAIIVLNTYMPPPCQQITPEIVFLDNTSKAYPARYIRREGDKFIYKINFKQKTFIDKITISSETIKTASPDVRVLSFPFINLGIKK
jgi:hypothetical protein